MTGVRNIRTIAIESVDMAAARDFAVCFGLVAAEDGNEVVLRCEGRDQDQIRIREGRHRQIRHVEFGVDAGALETMAKQIEHAGARLLDPPAGADGSGLWVRDPDQTLIHIVDTAPAPARPFPYWPLNQAGRMERFDIAWYEHLPRAARPRRLMHALAFVSDQSRAEQFYFEALGFRLSDRVPGMATFMNGTNGDHHIFGLIKSDGPGLHHAAWEVDNVDSIFVGSQEMMANGYRDSWGFGRHNLGSNYFHYFRGPHNLWFEYSCDIDQVTENWVEKDSHIKPWAWGPPPPADFTDNDA